MLSACLMDSAGSEYEPLASPCKPGNAFPACTKAEAPFFNHLSDYELRKYFIYEKLYVYFFQYLFIPSSLIILIVICCGYSTSAATVLLCHLSLQILSYTECHTL
jgi:hypothetical protein